MDYKNVVAFTFGFNYFFDGDILIWTTADGTEVPITEMDGKHILNIIRMLSITDYERYEVLIDIFEAELNRRKNNIRKFMREN